MTISFNQPRKPYFVPFQANYVQKRILWFRQISDIYICKNSELSNAQILRKAANRQKAIDREINRWKDR